MCGGRGIRTHGGASFAGVPAGLGNQWFKPLTQPSTFKLSKNSQTTLNLFWTEDLALFPFGDNPSPFSTASRVPNPRQTVQTSSGKR